MQYNLTYPPTHLTCKPSTLSLPLHKTFSKHSPRPQRSTADNNSCKPARRKGRRSPAAQRGCHPMLRNTATRRVLLAPNGQWRSAQRSNGRLQALQVIMREREECGVSSTFVRNFRGGLETRCEWALGQSAVGQSMLVTGVLSGGEVQVPYAPAGWERVVLGICHLVLNWFMLHTRVVFR